MTLNGDTLRPFNSPKIRLLRAVEIKGSLSGIIEVYNFDVQKIEALHKDMFPIRNATASTLVIKLSVRQYVKALMDPIL